MKTAREVPVIAETEVLVVGSGPGGLSAALAAARVGARTLLVERFGCLGGNITVVGVEALAWYRREGTVDSEGIGVELEQRAKAMGATSPGRCIAGDEISHAAVRSMMCCAVTGQAAGVAAAVSIREGVDVRSVSIEHVQRELVRQGARIH